MEIKGHKRRIHMKLITIDEHEEMPHSVSSIEEIRRRVDQAGGVMIAAHPFRRLAATSALNDGPLKLVDSIAERPIFRYVDDLEVLNGTSSYLGA